MLPIDYRLLKSGNQLLLSKYSMYYFVLCTMYFQCTAFLYSIWSPMIHLIIVSRTYCMPGAVLGTVYVRKTDAISPNGN